MNDSEMECRRMDRLYICGKCKGVYGYEDREAHDAICEGYLNKVKIGQSCSIHADIFKDKAGLEMYANEHFYNVVCKNVYMYMKDKRTGYIMLETSLISNKDDRKDIPFMLKIDNGKIEHTIKKATIGDKVNFLSTYLDVLVKHRDDNNA